MHRHISIAQTLLILSILNLVAAVPVVPQEVPDIGIDEVEAVEDVKTVSEMRRGAEPTGTGMTLGQYLQSPPDSSPPHGSLPLEESALLQNSVPSSGWPSSSYSAMDRVPTSEHPLSAAGQPATVPDPSTGASTSAHPLSVDNPDYFKPYGLSSDASVEEIKNAYKKMAMNWPKANPVVSAPVPDSNTVASTSSQRPATVSVPKTTAEGPTPQYTTITHDMLNKGPDKYAKLKSAGGVLFVGGFIATIVFLSAWHNNKNDTGKP